MYSAALPFLYLTTVLTILFIYAVDKVSCNIINDK